MDYELLEHTADAKFRAYGKTKEEAFANAAKALTAVIVDPEAIGNERETLLTVEANDLKKLLFDFIDEILFLMDTEGLVVKEATNLEITGTDTFKLTTMLKGDDVKKYGGNLKAMTYSEMICEQQGDKWVIQVVVDI